MSLPFQFGKRTNSSGRFLEGNGLAALTIDPENQSFSPVFPQRSARSLAFGSLAMESCNLCLEGDGWYRAIGSLSNNPKELSSSLKFTRFSNL